MNLNEEINRIKVIMGVICEKVYDTDHYSSSVISRVNPRYDYDNRDIEPEYYDEYDDEEDNDEDIFDIPDEEDEEDDYKSELTMFPDLNYGEKDNDPDLRTTLYWNPYVLTDPKNHKVKLEFYNNDVSNKLRIILEGVNADGKLAHVEKVVE